MGWADNYIAKLQAGETVQFRPRGNSMTGLVNDGDLVIVSPMKTVDGKPSPNSLFLTDGSIVLCRVAGNQYLHLVKACRHPLYQIGNNKGHINGWTHIDKIYGILTKRP